MQKTVSKNAPENREAAPHRGVVQPAGLAAPAMPPVLVLVLWVFCLAVGVLGFAVPYSRPKVICFCDPIVEVQKLEVELKEDQTPPLPADPSQPPPPLDAMTPPPLPQPSSPVALAAPSAPAIVAVAPSPAIAFALPVVNPQQLARVASAASYRAPVAQTAAPANAASPVARPLPDRKSLTPRFDPKPKYPERANKEGQEGVVLLRVAIASDGKVKSAEIIEPCPWPELNEAALDTVVKRWRWPRWTGELRVIDQPIRFDNPNRLPNLSSQP